MRSEEEIRDMIELNKKERIWAIEKGLDDITISLNIQIRCLEWVVLNEK